MRFALQEAKMAMQNGEVPVGVVIVRSDKVISQSGNLINLSNDATAHAELVAIKNAHSKLQSRFLVDCDIYTTLEPCVMCSGAISLARIRRLYFGAYDVKTGAIYNGPKVLNNSSCHHKPEIYGGFMEKECSQLLSEFFQGIRKKQEK
ncbi:MAG: nucleoside deaminase [Rickettsiaceae bacterium H1]|nr:nucleoside deaminase [Rickettsiaceae bacterium H1]